LKKEEEALMRNYTCMCVNDVNTSKIKKKKHVKMKSQDF